MDKRVGYSLFGVTADSFEHKAYGLLENLNELDRIIRISPDFLRQSGNENLYAIYKINSHDQGWLSLFCVYQTVASQSGESYVGACIGVAGKLSRKNVESVHHALFNLLSQVGAYYSEPDLFANKGLCNVLSNEPLDIPAHIRLQPLSYVNSSSFGVADAIVLLEEGDIEDVFLDIQSEYYGKGNHTLYIGREEYFSEGLGEIEKIYPSRIKSDRAASQQNQKVDELDALIKKIISENNRLYDEESVFEKHKKKYDQEIQALTSQLHEKDEIISEMQKEMEALLEELSNMDARLQKYEQEEGVNVSAIEPFFDNNLYDLKYPESEDLRGSREFHHEGHDVIDELNTGEDEERKHHPFLIIFLLLILVLLIFLAYPYYKDQIASYMPSFDQQSSLPVIQPEEVKSIQPQERQVNNLGQYISYLESNNPDAGIRREALSHCKGAVSEGLIDKASMMKACYQMYESCKSELVSEFTNYDVYYGCYRSCGNMETEAQVDACIAQKNDTKGNMIIRENIEQNDLPDGWVRSPYFEE